MTTLITRKHKFHGVSNAHRSNSATTSPFLLIFIPNLKHLYKEALSCESECICDKVCIIISDLSADVKTCHIKIC